LAEDFGAVVTEQHDVFLQVEEGLLEDKVVVAESGDDGG
jgi:hypothetical protein